MTQRDFKVQTKILWVGLDSNREEAESLKDSTDYVGTYQGFLNFLKTAITDQETPLFLRRGIIITDIVPISSRVQGDVVFYDLTFSKDRLESFLVEPQANLEGLLVTASFSIYTIQPTNNPRDYYKEVLATYHRVTFFDHFNTFKYIIYKDLRTSLETSVYKYFSSLIDIDTFRDNFSQLEGQLKANQLDRFIPVKNFVLSSRAEVLLNLVSETNQEKIKNALEEYALDYFDVNYLKAYLRDFGKTKEEKSKRKERVQDVSFTEQAS